jgi:hypothetical protein
MPATDLADSVGYCGLYCNACSIRQGKIEEAVNNLSEIIARFGFDRNMPDLANWEPSFKHYDDFKQVMNGLVKVFGYCEGCLGNGGDPSCKVRTCARQKGHRTCVECSEANSCKKLDPYRKYFEPALQSIRDKGVKGYAEEMQKKVDQGYSYPVEPNNPP